MIYIIRINDKEFEVEVEKGKAEIVNTVMVSSQMQAEIMEQPAKATVASQSANPVEPVKEARSNVVSTSGTVIKSPMPGVIVGVKVNVGDKVTVGKTLVVLEAMKMENEISSTVNGVVKEIIANKGQTVDTDAPILVIG